jgi:hypothetical protein
MAGRISLKGEAKRSVSGWHCESCAKLVIATIAGPSVSDLAMTQKFGGSSGEKHVAALRTGRPLKDRVGTTGRIAG